MQKGEYNEKVQSSKVLNNQIPFLISPILLRQKGLGQIDLAYIHFTKMSRKIIIQEIKSQQGPGKEQYRRLIKSQEYLSKLLDLETELKIIFCQKTNDSLF